MERIPAGRERDEKGVETEKEPQAPPREVVQLGEEFDLFPSHRTVEKPTPRKEGRHYYTTGVELRGEGIPDFLFDISARASYDAEQKEIDVVDPYRPEILFLGQLKDESKEVDPEIIDRLRLLIISPNGHIFGSSATNYDQPYVIIDGFNWGDASWTERYNRGVAGGNGFKLIAPKDPKEATGIRGKFVLVPPQE